MSDLFVPFNSEPSKGRQANSAFRVTVMPKDEQVPSFVPVPQPVPAQGHAHDLQEPQVELDREGDRITRITVRCSCGQVIELNCTY